MWNPQSISAANVDQQNLVGFLSNLFLNAVRIEHHHDAREHPIILLNALKNIIGDNKENPSEKLLTFAANYVDGFPQRTDDDVLLNRVRKDGVGLTVFTDEVEIAVMEGNTELAEIQSAKQILAANYSPATLELFAELALHAIDALGLFTFHWLRSYYFHQDQNAIWAYIRCMLAEMCKYDLEQNNNQPLQRPVDQIQSFMFNTDIDKVATFSALLRLDAEDYIRQEAFAVAISDWLNKQEHAENKFHDVPIKDIESYLNSGGSLFVTATEQLVAALDVKQAVKKIVQLEALRGIAKLSAPESFPAIANRINFLTAQS